MENKLSMKFLTIFLIVIFISSCGNDDNSNNEPTVLNILTLVDKTTGAIYSVDTDNGSLEELGIITYNGTALLGIRDFVFNESDSKIYASLDARSGGEIYSVDTATLEANLINDNDNATWDAVQELIISNGSLVGTAFINIPNYQHGLIKIGLDGTVNTAYDFRQNSAPVNTCCGMGLVFGDNLNEILVSDEFRIMKSDLTGIISEIISLTPNGFPSGFSDFDYVIKSIEKVNDNVIYALVYDFDENVQYLAEIDLVNNKANYIAELSSNKMQGLTSIPEGIF